MSQAVEQIKAAIDKLSDAERAELDVLLYEDDEWDKQMKRDAAAGKFDRLIREAEAEMDAGELRDLP